MQNQSDCNKRKMATSQKPTWNDYEFAFISQCVS